MFSCKTGTVRPIVARITRWWFIDEGLEAVLKMYVLLNSIDICLRIAHAPKRLCRFLSKTCFGHVSTTSALKRLGSLPLTRVLMIKGIELRPLPLQKFPETSCILGCLPYLFFVDPFCSQAFPEELQKGALIVVTRSLKRVLGGIAVVRHGMSDLAIVSVR